MFSDEGGGLSFGGALVAVIVGGWASSFAAPFAAAVTPFLSPYASGYAWVVVGAVAGGFGVKLALGLFGYPIPYVAAAGALFVGNAVGIAVPKLLLAGTSPALGPFVGGFGLFASLPGLLLSALIIQAAAGGPRRTGTAA